MSDAEAGQSGSRKWGIQRTNEMRITVEQWRTKMNGQMIPDKAVEAAAKMPYEAIVEASRAIDDDAYALIGWEGITRILEAAAPHLVAREFSPTRWWRAIAPDGSLLAETSATDDFTHLDLIDNPGVTFQRLYEEVPASVWRDETP